MSIREQIKEANAARVKYEEQTLPVSGAAVLCKGLMYGEQMDALAAASEGGRLQIGKYHVKLIAHGTYEREGQRVWRPDVAEDLQEIEALAPEEANFLQETISRLSGLDKKTEGEETGKGILVALPVLSESSPTSSPSTSAAA